MATYIHGKRSLLRTTKPRMPHLAKKGLQVSDIWKNIFRRAICVLTMFSHFCECQKSRPSVQDLSVLHPCRHITVMNPSHPFPRSV